MQGNVHVLTDLADTGNAGDHQLVVAVALHSRLTEEQVNFVIVSLSTVVTLRHLGHGDKVWLWRKRRKKGLSF